MLCLPWGVGGLFAPDPLEDAGAGGEARQRLRPASEPPGTLWIVEHDPDSYRERAQRAVQGRRGCRAAKEIADREAILSFVIWHRYVDRVVDAIVIAEGNRPGAIASFMCARFAREFEREEIERRSVAAPSADDVAYSHQWSGWSNDKGSETVCTVGFVRSYRKPVVEFDEVPPNGITFGYQIPKRKVPWRP